MAVYEFTATHGVDLEDLGVRFEFDADATGSSSERVYSAKTEDAAVAKALREVDDYGIAEVKPARKSKADD